MWTDRTASLGDYIVALIDALAEAQPHATLRMRQVVGERRARIVLDEEAVDVWFEPDRLRVERAGAGQVDGWGATDSATVLALLDGVLEISDAILDGYLRVTGAAQDITRFFLAVEILLDASPRVPELQKLADRFRAERRQLRTYTVPGAGRAPWYPFRSGKREADLLAKFELDINSKIN